MLVTIKCCQKIYYNQDVEMDEDDFDKLSEFSGEDIDVFQKEYNIIDDHLNTNDVFDTDQEFTEFEIFKAKTNK